MVELSVVMDVANLWNIGEYMYIQNYDFLIEMPIIWKLTNCKVNVENMSYRPYP